MDLDNPLSIFDSGRQAARERAGEIIHRHFVNLPAGTTMATKDLLLDIYNEIMENTDGNLQEEG